MGKIKLLLLLLLLLVSVFGFLIVSGKLDISNENRGKNSEKKSDFRFVTIDNKIINMNVADKEFKIEGMENKIVFLKAFGWDCNFCQKEIPELIRLKKELGSSFEVIAIEAQNHSLEESQAFKEKYGINYHLILGMNQKKFYTYLQDKYGWSGVIPLTIVIANGGQVLAFEVGSKSYSLSELIQASLLRK